MPARDPINYMGFAFEHGLNGFTIGECKCFVSFDVADHEDNEVEEGKVGIHCEKLSKDKVYSPDYFV